eukprot:CAMPEP_0178998902 /NCGR_PEP_ID=MMETSP0795-20121207/9757_1 /TAXON_ID=88552 /ORGANISM="Amoebophrya sp., Strain Ameob2" /LENGTH=103 /DNA_ID=CAMNT_0020691605 /DNA_START=780 /DNA_END=1089 /DNA_ORIENTATION=-
MFLTVLSLLGVFSVSASGAASVRPGTPILLGCAVRPYFLPSLRRREQTAEPRAQRGDVLLQVLRELAPQPTKIRPSEFAADVVRDLLAPPPCLLGLRADDQVL